MAAGRKFGMKRWRLERFYQEALSSLVLAWARHQRGSDIDSEMALREFTDTPMKISFLFFH